MNLFEWFLVVFIAFLSGMGNRMAGEFIDWFKKKREFLQQRIMKGGEVDEE